MFNIRGKITSKLLEIPFIWIYGSKSKARIEALKFIQNPVYMSKDEAYRAFINADFWEYLIGWKKGERFNLSGLLFNIKNVDIGVLLAKITNPYQIELIRKKQYEKTSVGLKIFNSFITRKSVNKQTICDEFGIGNETLVKWIDFMNTHEWIQRCNADISEEFKPLLNNLQDFKKQYKISLLDYMLLQRSLNKDNPVSTLIFTKADLSNLINGGFSNLYKNLDYIINDEELDFNIYPFTIFKQLAKNNGYDHNDEVLKKDLEDILQKKKVNSAVSDSHFRSA